jgi:hypothetical protein
VATPTQTAIRDATAWVARVADIYQLRTANRIAYYGAVSAAAKAMHNCLVMAANLPAPETEHRAEPGGAPRH